MTIYIALQGEGKQLNIPDRPAVEEAEALLHMSSQSQPGEQEESTGQEEGGAVDQEQEQAQEAGGQQLQAGGQEAGGMAFTTHQPLLHAIKNYIILI